MADAVPVSGTGSDRTAPPDRRILLILRTPPPYGGGEIIGQQLERLFAGRFSLLTFRRTAHHKQRQGRVNLSNLAFGVRYVTQSSLRLVAQRPRVVYVDLPKDRVSFLRTSGIVLVARALGVRVIGDLAGADFEFLNRRGPMRRYGLAILRRLHAIRVLGESIAETLERHGLANAVVLSNGISDPPGTGEALDAPAGLTRFLYVGKISEAKGIRTLLDFVRAFEDDGEPFELEIVGEWESEATRSSVLDAVATLGVADRIGFRGLLVGDEKWHSYRKAHILLHPSHWDGQPVTILEALAFGVPVVATCVGAIPDTITSGVDGYLMRVNSAGEIVKGVRQILRDGETYARFSSGARASYLSRFSATIFGVRMAELLRSALPARGARAGGERVRIVTGADDRGVRRCSR